jgi:Na+-transporting NADH:ubiquinone oxidoreductase subunit NqrB
MSSVRVAVSLPARSGIDEALGLALDWISRRKITGASIGMETTTPSDDAADDPDRGPAVSLLQTDWLKTLALVLPLLVRLSEEETSAALERLAILMVTFAVAWGWSAVFARRLKYRPEESQAQFAMLFTVMLPVPVELGGVVISASFGWVVGNVIFGGKPILPPALVALAFAIFSFPGSGYEVQNVLSISPSPLLALSCLPGAVLLLWKRLLPWRTIAGVVAGASVALYFMGDLTSQVWWQHVLSGTFCIGVLFVAAAPEAVPDLQPARWAYGALVGWLIIVIRLKNPEQPDGVVFAILVGCLLAPLLDRALNWGTRHD